MEGNIPPAQMDSVAVASDGDAATTTVRKEYLIHFAHRHPDFKLDELESVLDMHRVPSRPGGPHLAGYRFLPLPGEDPGGYDDDGRRRLGRGQSGLTLQAMRDERPFALLSVDVCSSRGDDDAVDAAVDGIVVRAASRCILVRAAYEIWGRGATLEHCAGEVRSGLGLEGDDGVRHPYVVRHCLPLDRSWKMTVSTFGVHLSREEQGRMRSKFSFLPLAGPVRMKDPDTELALIGEVEVDGHGNPVHKQEGRCKGSAGDGGTLAYYFGRALPRDGTAGDDARYSVPGAPPPGCRESPTDLRFNTFETFSLKRRRYLGPTSMDAELSAVMTNLGQVRASSFLFDPFAGTGSIMVAGGLAGAPCCVGTDIDVRVLRGRGGGEDVVGNFVQMGLARPELVRADNSLHRKHFRDVGPLYDAIVCDPPYGIRAGARQCGSRREVVAPVPEGMRHDHIAQTKPYAVSDVMADLLDVAARTLVMGSRLVYIIPSVSIGDEEEEESDGDLPRHPCLKLLYSCYQPLQMHLGRRVVTMQKTSEYDEARREEYKMHCWANGAEGADRVANFREKLMEAARKKPGYAEKAEFKSKKRRENKMLKKAAKKGLGCQKGLLSEKGEGVV
eukprot:CAMPEP_0194276100 /NCGR_PEP_ID=MMETSP0169-20130528/8774_1 /TAXON_ID=218684 /ORGANISM="Corethron pennatum, Strain L29A3" /LENGTH=614 /DNA_ID=CAMNT_0039019731 /DNA_START=50 /DNA_END=1890 /DNA_ORIENTATION=-